MGRPITSRENEIIYSSTVAGVPYRKIVDLLAAEGFTRAWTTIANCDAYKRGRNDRGEKPRQYVRHDRHLGIAEESAPVQVARRLPYPVVRLPDFPTVSLPWISAQAEWAA